MTYRRCSATKSKRLILAECLPRECAEYTTKNPCLISSSTSQWRTNPPYHLSCDLARDCFGARIIHYSNLCLRSLHWMIAFLLNFDTFHYMLFCKFLSSYLPFYMAYRTSGSTVGTVMLDYLPHDLDQLLQRRSTG